MEAISPGTMFENAKDGVIAALPCQGASTGAAVDIVSAIPGKRIRIICGTWTSTAPGAAAGLVALSGGVAAGSMVVGPSTPAIVWPYNPAGWYETNTGSALTVSGAGGGGAFNGTYIAYTP